MLMAGRTDEAIERRASALEERAGKLFERFAEWGANDRPSIEYILAQASGE